MAQLYCNKCGRTLKEDNFYKLRTGDRSDLCKSCETMHVNNFESDTFLWLLEKYDIPWLPWEWQRICDIEYGKDPYKFGPMSVFGRYLANMKLKQHKDHHWADSDRLQFEHKKRQEEMGTPEEVLKEQLAEMEKKYKNGEISEAQWLTYKGVHAIEKPKFKVQDGVLVSTEAPDSNSPYPVNDNPFEKVDLPDVSKDLTDDDKIYLATKWGQLYSAADWLYLENKYKDFMESFDIQGAARIDTLIQICKLSLKMNTALDSGDMDSYSKLVRAYDSLMKSAKFTEAQKKEVETGEFSSYGQIVAYAELTTGEIPRMDISVDRDIVDADIRDIKAYNKSLIDEDPAIFKMIEQYIKKRELAQQQEADRKEAAAAGLDYVPFDDEDLAEFNEAQQKQKDEDDREEDDD